MPKSLSELDLKDEPMPQMSYDDVPETGSFQPPPQPGPYGWQLPSNLANIYEVVDTDKGQRIQAIFDGAAPLTIIESQKDASKVGDTFQTRISNVERARGRDKSMVVSDLDYLLKALGETTRPTSNRGYIETLSRHGGDHFHADVTYSWVCSESRPKYVFDAQTGKNVKIEGQMGCGWRYYTGDKSPDQAKRIGYVDKTNGVYPTDLQCQCGASLRAFANLDNFRA